MSLLITVAPAAQASFAAFRALARARRTVARAPGFVAWRSFRALDASDALHFVIDWEAGSARDAAVPVLLDLAQQARLAGFRVGPFRNLAPQFDRQITPGASPASLLRIGPASPADGDCAMRALAAPGVTRTCGARTDDGETGVTRIDFEGEDGLWPFLDGPLRYRWSEQSLGETWALNLPRLEASVQAAADAPALVPAGAGVELRRSPDGRAASIRMYGQVDADGSRRTVAFCEALVRQGCSTLHVDLSGLASISPAALAMLTRTARALRAAGGHFTLIDNAQRARRATRRRELEAVFR